MLKIQMVDLNRQYLKIREEINSAILEVIESSAFINGPAVKHFSEEFEKYLGIKNVIPCANGTDALQVALMALGLKPGDEVISPTFTFISSAEIIALLKLKPVLVDVDERSFNLDLNLLEKAITPQTKAIIPVHLFGQNLDMEALTAIAKKHNLFVIEDACQSMGSEYIFENGKRVKSGTVGDIGCTSFFPSKNLAAYGDGGALFTNNDLLAGKIRSIVNHGMTVRYYHDDIGVNSRLDSIQAAILNVKLKYFDSYIKARQNAANFYDSAFKDHPKLIVPFRSAKSTHAFHQYTLITKGVNRSKLIEYLHSKDIPAMIYYPVPLHLQKAFSFLGHKEGDFPVSEQLAASVVSLPIHTELDEEQLNYISSNILEFLS